MLWTSYVLITSIPETSYGLAAGILKTSYRQTLLIQPLLIVYNLVHLIIEGGSEMDVFSAIQDRRSIRKYSSRPIEEEKLKKILEAGRLSPSANNKQSWKFIVVRDSLLKESLMEAAGGQLFVGQAPAVLILCGTEPDSIMFCGQHRYTVDLSIAMSFMVLEACELGIGTCWLGHFNEEKVKHILGIPKNVRVVAMTPLGYADESPAARPRKALDEIVCYDGYDE